MIAKELLLGVVEEVLQGKDLFLVELKCSTNNEIEVVIDSMQAVDITRCIEVSKEIESRLDREKEDFELTVASAGIGDSLSMTEQFIKHQNKEVNVVLKNGEKLAGVMTNPTLESFQLTYSMKVLEEGKKRKQLKEFTDEIRREDVKSVKLVLKF